MQVKDLFKKIVGEALAEKEEYIIGFPRPDDVIRDINGEARFTPAQCAGMWNAVMVHNSPTADLAALECCKRLTQSLIDLLMDLDPGTYNEVFEHAFLACLAHIDHDHGMIIPT